jgi:PilZ domain
VSTSEWKAGRESGRERRLSPRVNLLMDLKGELIALDEPATVQQLSLRGMTVHTNVPLSPNGTHEFRLYLEGSRLDVKTRVVHSRVMVERDDVSYISGLAFVDLTPDAEAALDTLIHSLETADDTAG